MHKVSQSGSRSGIVRAGGQQVLHDHEVPNRKAERPRLDSVHTVLSGPSDPLDQSSGRLVTVLPTVDCVEVGVRKVFYPACILQLERVRIVGDVLVASESMDANCQARGNLIRRIVPTNHTRRSILPRVYRGTLLYLP